MKTSNYVLDILVGVAALTVALVVGRDNIKKRTIEDLQDLVETLTLKIVNLEKTVCQLRDENAELKETIDGYTELVRQGHLTGSSGSRGRNRATPAKTP